MISRMLMTSRMAMMATARGRGSGAGSMSADRDEEESEGEKDAEGVSGRRAMPEGARSPRGRNAKMAWVVVGQDQKEATGEGKP